MASVNKLLKNEKMFAEMNKRMARTTVSLAPAEFPRDFVLELYCECANKACYERMSIPGDEYSRAKNSDFFVVKPEHYLAEFERVVEQSSEYWLIIKRPEKLEKQFEV